MGYKPLTDWWKEKLTELTEKGAMKDSGVKIEKVEISKRLTDSPVVVVTSQFGYSAQQEKVMKAQSFQNKDQINMMSGRKTLEVDPDAPLKEVEVPEGEEEEEEAEEEDKDDSDSKDETEEAKVDGEGKKEKEEL